MRSITHRKYGEPATVLHVEDAPDPGSPKGDEVLIRIGVRPINLGALLGIRGRYRPSDKGNEAPPQPTKIGVEGVGFVEAVGDAVPASSGIAPGARVVFFPVPGSWNELVLAPASFVTPIPAEIPDAVAGQLHLNPVTALLLLRAAEAAGARSAEDGAIIVDAAGSSVGRLIAAIARGRGVPIVGLVRHRKAAALMSDFASIVTTEDADWREQLQAASNGKGFRVGLDAVGGDAGTALFENLAPGGALITYGDLSNEPLRMNALTIAARDLHISGVIYAGWRNLSAEQRDADVRLAIELACARPDLFPVAGQYDLSRVAEAVAHAERSGKDGLVLLTSDNNSTIVH